MNLMVEVAAHCPYCGDEFPMTVDTSEGDYETTEDCAVCCRPIVFSIACEPGAVHTIEGAIG
ncbi:MAG: CPXCG motif-containing cysteine-rich protein [Chthoniobacteraceae bacterium]